MRYYTARQRMDKKWDFTCGRCPVGYCAAYKEWTKEELEKFGLDEVFLQKVASFKEKHHTCGHETEKEAQECYKQYLLDQELRFGEIQDAQYKCRICKKWTQKYASFSTSMWFLCDEHCNREGVDQIYEAPTDIWIS
jgi:hypothetical protein